MTSSLFDQTITVQSANLRDDATVSPLRGIVTAAAPSLISALAMEGITAAVVIYTPDDPGVAVGDSLVVAGMAYPVVAPTRPYASSALNMRVYETPCGSETAT